MIYEVTDSKKLDELEKSMVEDPNYTKKGPESALSHLKSALYDWRVENQWENPTAYVYSFDDVGYMFISMTKREPRHCTLRHIFILEEGRGKRAGVQLIEKMREVMKEKGVNILRMFINRPALGFYNKLGFNDFHGVSKTNMPFYYGDPYGNLVTLPQAQKRYLKPKEVEPKLDEWL